MPQVVREADPDTQRVWRERHAHGAQRATHGRAGHGFVLQAATMDGAESAPDMILLGVWHAGINPLPEALESLAEALPTVMAGLPDASWAAVREQAGIVDIYVSNAGVPTTGMGYGKFLESRPEDWERFVKLNMYGLMNGCHAVLPGMGDPITLLVQTEAMHLFDPVTELRLA